MTQSKFNINSKKNYFSSTSQYLDNRNLSYRNNNYFQIREGDKTSTPGTTQAISNVYSNTINNQCPVFNIEQPLTVSYKWVDDTTNNVTFPVGKYDLSDIPVPILVRVFIPCNIKALGEQKNPFFIKRKKIHCFQHHIFFCTSERMWFACVIRCSESETEDKEGPLECSQLTSLAYASRK